MDLLMGFTDWEIMIDMEHPMNGGSPMIFQTTPYQFSLRPWPLSSDDLPGEEHGSYQMARVEAELHLNYQ